MRSFFVFLFSFTVCFSLSTCSSGVNDRQIKNNTNKSTERDTTKNPCIEFNALYINIRDGLIKKEDAKKNIITLLSKIETFYTEKGGKIYNKSERVFPIQGYNSKAIGGNNGNGYSAMGYDFFDGNKHRGHPAQDIFITDINQDCNDDHTLLPVNILSMTGGIVVACESEWSAESPLRGGKYILVFDPNDKSLIYYAHNNKLFVNIGDIIKPGDKIAEVGRSGLNAYKKRSPTHLHLMYLNTDQNGEVSPINIYLDLLKLKTIK
jgi:peptidoglycan LD-endopeptidase LytH